MQAGTIVTYAAPFSGPSQVHLFDHLSPISNISGALLLDYKKLKFLKTPEHHQQQQSILKVST